METKLLFNYFLTLIGWATGLFLILAPALTEVTNKTVAWTFFPLFGTCVIWFTVTGSRIERQEIRGNCNCI